MPGIKEIGGNTASHLRVSLNVDSALATAGIIHHIFVQLPEHHCILICRTNSGKARELILDISLHMRKEFYHIILMPER